MNDQEKALAHFSNIWRKFQEAMDALALQQMWNENSELVKRCVRSEAEVAEIRKEISELDRIFGLESPK